VKKKMKKKKRGKKRERNTCLSPEKGGIRKEKVGSSLPVSTMNGRGATNAIKSELSTSVI
jgi:hypothetical protein